MVEGELHIMYIYGDLCSVFYYVMLILLHSVESELIYVANNGCHWLRFCDSTTVFGNGLFITSLIIN